jgi:hypothetical protein
MIHSTIAIKDSDPITDDVIVSKKKSMSLSKLKKEIMKTSTNEQIVKILENKKKKT